MDMIKEWVSNLFIFILVVTFAEILMPESSLGKYVKFIFSLLIMAAIIYPFVDFIKAY